MPFILGLGWLAVIIFFQTSSPFRPTGTFTSVPVPEQELVQVLDTTTGQMMKDLQGKAVVHPLPTKPNPTPPPAETRTAGRYQVVQPQGIGGKVYVLDTVTGRVVREGESDFGNVLNK